MSWEERLRQMVVAGGLLSFAAAGGVYDPMTFTSAGGVTTPPRCVNDAGASDSKTGPVDGSDG
jgi:hypothetical protein